MRAPTTKDVQRAQQFLKATWEASQGWLWLALMGLSIAVNFSHIENILAQCAGVSDWTTWIGALVVEAISGLAWSNALTNLSVMLASTSKKGMSNEKRRRAKVYFGLSLAFGLIAVGFSAYANILWFKYHYEAGLVAPAATVICAVMEASRRYEIRVVTERKESDTQKKEERKQREAQRHRMETLGAAAGTLMALQRNPMATQVELAAAIEKSRTTVRNHLATLVEAGAIKRDGDGSIEVLWTEKP